MRRVMPCFRQLSYRPNPILAKKVLESSKGVFVIPDIIDSLCIAVDDAPILNIREETFHIGTVNWRHVYKNWVDA
jgi:hypothetical protein